jgi:predicted nucleotidyltransferase
MDTKQKVTKILQFNHIVNVILIPTWRELKNVNLFDSIWYDSVFFKNEKQNVINEIREYSKENNISIEESYNKLYKL